MNRKFLTFVWFSVVLLLAVSSARAQSDYQGWRFRVFGGIVCRCVESDNVSFDDPIYGMSATEVDGSSLGFGAGVERRFSKLLGLDLAVGYTTMDVVFTQSLTPDQSKDTLKVLPVWLAVNFHVINTEKVDFWVGPQIGYVSWNDPLTFDVPGQEPYVVPTENEFPAIGLVLGLDYWLSENGALNFGFRFVDADADVNHNLPVDPTFITVGYTMKF
jgi:outer membrane protein W